MLAEHEKPRNMAAHRMVGKVALAIGSLGRSLRELESDVHHLADILGYGERELRLQRHNTSGMMRIAAVDPRSGELLNHTPWREVS